MPLHKLPHLTGADVGSLITSFLFLVQPGVDRAAVLQWMTDNVFGSPEATRVWGVFVVHKVFEYVMLALFSLVYYLEIPFIERHKVRPQDPWPWKSEKKGARENYLALVWRSAKYIATFHAVVLVINYLIVKPDRLDLVDPANMPSRWTVVWQTLAGTLCAETGFYFAHRALHTKALYSHHKRHHEYMDSTVWATMYVSPLDAFLTDIIPAGIPIVFLDMHIYTVWVFTLSLLLNAFIVHSGYVFPSRINPFVALPLATESELTHDLHHIGALSSDGKSCNYGGAFFFFDRVFGTFRDPIEFKREAREAALAKLDGKKAQ